MKFISEITVNPIQQMGSDAMVVAAARVSTSGEEAEALAKAEETSKNFGIINYLIQHRHGTPFEHGALTVFVHAPIFVWREWHRHRVGFSYNEESGRYKQLDPVFWIPSRKRKLIPVSEPERCTTELMASFGGFYVCDTLLEKQKGGIKTCPLCKLEYKYNVSARPFFQEADDKSYELFVKNAKHGYQAAYESYKFALELGIAKEAARVNLPVGIYSSCWVTCNPRSLMAFLSLRTYNKDAQFVSYPQAEIEEAANKLEEIFKKYWPLTYQAFVQNGRVGP